MCTPEEPVNSVVPESHPSQDKNQQPTGKILECPKCTYARDEIFADRSTSPATVKVCPDCLVPLRTMPQSSQPPYPPAVRVPPSPMHLSAAYTFFHKLKAAIDSFRVDITSAKTPSQHEFQCGKCKTFFSVSALMELGHLSSFDPSKPVCPQCAYDWFEPAPPFGVFTTLPNNPEEIELLESRKEEAPLSSFAEQMIELEKVEALEARQEEEFPDAGSLTTIYDTLQRGHFGDRYDPASGHQRQVVKALLLGCLYQPENKKFLNAPENDDGSDLYGASPVDTTDRIVHETGAVRSSSCSGLRPDLLSPLVLMSMSAVMAEGSQKYGDHNWLKGFKYSEILTHLFIHLWKWQAGDQSEDHLGHALWNLAALKHFEITGRSDLDDRAPAMLKSDELAKIETWLRHGTERVPTWVKPSA